MSSKRNRGPQDRSDTEKTGGTEHEAQIPYTHQLFIDRQPVHRAAQRHRPRRRATGRYSGSPNRDLDHEYRDQIRHPRPRPDHDDHDNGEEVGGPRRHRGKRNDRQGQRDDNGNDGREPGRLPGYDRDTDRQRADDGNKNDNGDKRRSALR